MTTTHKTTTTTLTVVDASLQKLLNQYHSTKEVIIISEESAAAVQALLKWIFNVDSSAVTLRKISHSRHGSRIQIVHLTHTYTVDII